MGYKTEKVEMPLSLGLIQEFEYALIYRISGVELSRTGDLESVEWEECQEARFFSEEKELRVFDTEDGMQAVLVSDEGDGGRFVKRYAMAPKFSGMGRALKVVEYITYDEDGQMRIALTRLAGVE